MLDYWRYSAVAAFFFNTPQRVYLTNISGVQSSSERHFACDPLICPFLLGKYAQQTKITTTHFHSPKDQDVIAVTLDHFNSDNNNYIAAG